MRLERRFLRSRVARRIFLLFVLCALLPIVVVSTVASGFVATKLRDYGRDALRDRTKAMGMEVLSRLTLAEAELETLAVIIETRADADAAVGDRLIQRLATRFKGIALLEENEPPDVVHGNLTPPRLGAPARAHFAAGKAFLTTLGDAGDRRIFLARQLEEGSRPARVLIGEIAAGFLVGPDEGISLPAGSELFLLDSEQQVLYRSVEDHDPLPVGASRARTRSMSGEFDWELGGEAHFGSYWSLFLNSAYGSANWMVVVSTSRAEVLSPLAQFSRLLPMVLLVSFLMAVLFSFVQVRRSLVPLEELKRGTEGIAARRFDTRVVVESNDEFAQLAESFNSMAVTLGHQFGTLTTLAEIDRAVLSTWHEESVVRTVLQRIPDHFRCDCVSLTVLDGRATDRARLHIRWVDRAREPWTVDIRLTLPELIHLSREVDDSRLLVDDELPEHLELLTDGGMRYGLVVPIKLKGQPAGYVTIGSRDHPHYDEEELIEARRLANQIAVALSNARLVEDLEQANWETLHALARAVDANSPWTAGHSERVASMAVQLARRLDLPEAEIVVIHKGGLLHDVGKIGVPNEILDSPGKLTDEQLAVIRDHVRIGARILEPISAYAREIPIVLHHHERFDGQGYPDGLAGESIPYHARILAVADVYDALISERPYRPAWDRADVIDFIRDGAGSQFDPRVVAAFFECDAPAADRPDAAEVRECLMVVAE